MRWKISTSIASCRLWLTVCHATCLVLCICLAQGALADEVRVLKADAECRGEKELACSFKVTLRHADEGWEHYANRFEILLDGKVLATRILRHPHVDEQPFTRTLSDVTLPLGTKEVVVRASDNVHGVSPYELRVAIAPGISGKSSE